MKGEIGANGLQYDAQMIVSRRILVRVAVAVVVLFLLAFVRGAVGEVALYVFLLGVLLLIVLGVVALVQSARSRRPLHYRGLGRKPPRVSLAVALIPLAVVLAAFAAYSVVAVAVTLVRGEHHVHGLPFAIAVVLILVLAVLAAWLALRSWRCAKSN